MREVHISDSGVVEAVLDAYEQGAVLMQMPNVFAVTAPVTAKGAAALDAAKSRLPNKTYTTYVGRIENFYRMVAPGALPPEIDSAEGLEQLTPCILRVQVAPADFTSQVVRNGRHQTFLVGGPHRDLVLKLEDLYADRAEPDLFGGHVFHTILGSSANVSGDPRGPITDIDRAVAFGRERGVPLLVRCDRDESETGSPTIFNITREAITIERRGPRLEELKAKLPARLFKDA